jgi:SAM-dependent methyltransferase
VCGNATRPWLAMPIDAKTFQTTPFGRVLRCDRCGHASVFPLPTTEEVPKFYALDAYYTQGKSHMPEGAEDVWDKILTKLAWTFDRGIDLEQTLRQIDIGKRASVCEIGCGHAKNLAYLHKVGHMTLGVDPDPKAALEAAKIGIEVLLGTGEELPDQISADQFDLVIMSHSLEHCIDPVLTLRNVANILKPGGRFVCEVPNSECKHFLLNNICSEMFDAPRHLHFYNTGSLTRSINSAGLETESVEYTGFTRHHALRWRKVEQKIRSKLVEINAASPSEHTYLRSLLLWFSTFSSPAKKKYDSVRIIAVKPNKLTVTLQ